MPPVKHSAAHPQTVTVNAHGECRQVTNPEAGTRMVFTGTAAEWTSFRNNPSGLTMNPCGNSANVVLLMGQNYPTVGSGGNMAFLATANSIPYSGGSINMLQFSMSGWAFYLQNNQFGDMETYWEFSFAGDVRSVLYSHKLIIEDLTNGVIADLSYTQYLDGLYMEGGNTKILTNGMSMILPGGGLVPPLFTDHQYNIRLEPM